MPELPEVQTVCSVLKRQIVGRKITEISSNYPQMVEEDFTDFKNKLIGKTFTNITTKGKFLIFELEDIYLISHLRMEGKFFYQEYDAPLNKHIHMVFDLDNGYSLRYQDTRKFGRMVTKNELELYTTDPLAKLGPDANSDVDLELLYANIHKRRLPIKEVLLNQEIIAGLGNIYVDEVLAKSHISPLRQASSISHDELKEMLANAKEILDKAIVNKGTTIRSYTSSLGVTGNYQSFLLVHTKTICPYCNEKILKIKVGGRGTYYCEKCQK